MPVRFISISNNITIIMKTHDNLKTCVSDNFPFSVIPQPCLIKTLQISWKLSADHFPPLTFCWGPLERVLILWSPSIINDKKWTSQISEKINLWSKAIMKLKPFREAPIKKLGVENDRLGPEICFTQPKKLKSVLKVMYFCKTFWEILDFWKKSKISQNVLQKSMTFKTVRADQFPPLIFDGGFSKGF